MVLPQTKYILIPHHASFFLLTQETLILKWSPVTKEHIYYFCSPSIDAVYYQTKKENKSQS